ncbi:MAG: hypothetical protein F6K11_10950 [Leptolyngbya sp. SIO3F4]|nr:hypothetical protein [Leptolyngbya sp. SIO3F4]
MAISFVAEGVATLLRYSDPSGVSNNLPVYNAFAILFMIFMNRIYARLLGWRLLRSFWNVPLIALGLLAVVDAFFLEPFDAFQSIFISASFLVCIVFSFAYFVQVLVRSDRPFFARDPSFWLNAGIFIYCSATLILFLFINQILTYQPDAIWTPWRINAALFLLLNLFYSLALWMRPQD